MIANSGGKLSGRDNSQSGSPCAACDIRDLAFCAALSPTELERLRLITVDVLVEPHKTIFSETDPAHHVFTVTSGAVKLYKLLADGRRQITGFMYPGDFLGVALNDFYAYSAEAITRVVMCRYERTRLEGLFDEYPLLEKRLLNITANELIAAQDQMLLLGRKRADERVVSFLLGLARRAQRRGLPAEPVHLPMSRADIADYLGLTVETVSRTFSHLKREGLIELEGSDQVRFGSRKNLELIAEGESS